MAGAGRTRDATLLTHRTVEALRAEIAPYRVPDRRSAGLAIRVAPNGLKTWDLAYRITGTGKVRRTSLGRFPDTTLEQARERADARTRAARAGRDLIAEEEAARTAAAQRVSIEELIELYCRRRVRGRLKTAREIESRLRRSLGSILATPALDVRRREIGALLDAVADNGLEREAEKRRQTVGAMFRWALRQDIVEIDPTAGLTVYDPGTPSDRVLSLGEIGTLWRWLDEASFAPDVVDIMRLQIALGARCGEIAGLEVAEVDRSTWLWTLPAARSKNGKARVTPLAGHALRILRHRIAQTPVGRLFASEAGSPLTASHIGQALLHRRKALPISPFTTHDLRRSVATGLAEMGISLDLVAAILGHHAGGQGTRTLLRHYIRTDLVDRKRPALEGWDAKVSAAIRGEEGDDKIVQFPARA